MTNTAAVTGSSVKPVAVIVIVAPSNAFGGVGRTAGAGVDGAPGALGWPPQVNDVARPSAAAISKAMDRIRLTIGGNAYTRRNRTHVWRVESRRFCGDFGGDRRQPLCLLARNAPAL